MQRIEGWLIVMVVVVHASAVAAFWQQPPAPTPTKPVVMQAILLSPPAPVQAKPTPAALQPVAKPPEKKQFKPQVTKTTPTKAHRPHQRATPVTTSHVAAVQASSTPRSAPAVARQAPSYQAPSAEAQGLNNTAPAYPPTSRKKREQGVVWLEVHVGAQGELLALKLKTSSGFSRLDDAALRAVKNWRFQPALRDGKAVDAWYDLPVRFSLTG